MPGAAEVESFLNLFDASSVGVARQLVEERKVRILRYTPDAFEAEVLIEDEPLKVLFRKHRNAWNGSTETSGDTHKVAVCAAMLEAEILQEQKNARTEPQQSLQEILEE